MERHGDDEQRRMRTEDHVPSGHAGRGGGGAWRRRGVAAAGRNGCGPIAIAVVRPAPWTDVIIALHAKCTSCFCTSPKYTAP